MVVTESVPEPDTEPLPLPVRSHTSHLVSNKMVTLFGYSSGRSIYLSYVQEYNLGMCVCVCLIVNTNAKVEAQMQTGGGALSAEVCVIVKCFM